VFPNFSVLVLGVLVSILVLALEFWIEGLEWAEPWCPYWFWLSSAGLKDWNEPGPGIHIGSVSRGLDWGFGMSRVLVSILVVALKSGLKIWHGHSSGVHVGSGSQVLDRRFGMSRDADKATLVAPSSFIFK
jgi:hypothetical protein